MSPPLADVRVMAHPARGVAARALCARLAGLDPVIVWDPEPHGPPSAQRTARRAWGLPVRAGATHVVVLQDDVSVPVDFAERLTGLLAVPPDRALGLFAVWSSRTGQAVRLAAYRGLGLAPVLGSAVSATGLALPAALAADYGQALAGQVDHRDSLSVSDFCRAHRVPQAIAVPNLVQHDVPYLASIWPEKFVQGPRRSACFVPDQYPVRGGELARPTVLPYLSPDTLRCTVVLSGEDDQPPRTGPGWRYARQLGFDTGELLEVFGRSELAATRHALTGCLDPGFQYEIWLTGFLVGRVLAGAGGVELATAAAEEAGRTFAAGCLGRLLCLPLLDRVAGATADLVGQALRHGLAVPAGS